MIKKWKQKHLFFVDIYTNFNAEEIRLKFLIILREMILLLACVILL